MKARLLIIEDDQTFRERLGKAMTRRGYEVKEAADVDEGLAAAKEFHPTHALVDLRMPGANGLVAVRELAGQNPEIRIVVLTGFGSIATAVEALRLGACDYLTKPADGDQIERALLGCREESFARGNDLPAPSLERVEWEHMQRVLSDCNQNISQAARVLGIDRRSLQRKLQKYPPPPS